jgi:hypothetical protein
MGSAVTPSGGLSENHNGFYPYPPVNPEFILNLPYTGIEMTG